MSKSSKKEMIEDDHSTDSERGEQTTTVVTQSWADDVKKSSKSKVEETPATVIPPNSVANFDRAQAVEYETKVASELQIDQLLKLLIRRGEVQFNPALAKGAEKLLRQLNCEQIHPVRPRHNNNNNNKRRRWNKKKTTQEE